MDHEELKSKVGKSATKIWDAYQEVLEELKAKEAAPPSIAAVAEAQKAEAAIKLARTVDVNATASTAETIATGLREAKAEFDEVEAAIAKAKAELEDVHGIQAEADSLAALVAAKDRLVAEREEKAKVILSEAQEGAARLRDEAQADADKLRADAQEADRLAAQTRQRTQAEWDYDFSRKKRQAIDEVQDAIDVKRKSLDAREASLVEREKQADELDAKIADLESTIEAMKADLQAKVDAALEEGKKKAERSFGFQKQIIEKDHEGKLRVLEAANESLKERLAEMQTRLASAEAQVNAAGQRVTEIATASLKSQGDAATISKVAEVAAGAGVKK
jgi:chromosome segregation ATPase